MNRELSGKHKNCVKQILPRLQLVDDLISFGNKERFDVLSFFHLFYLFRE